MYILINLLENIVQLNAILYVKLLLTLSRSTGSRKCRHVDNFLPISLSQLESYIHDLSNICYTHCAKS